MSETENQTVPPAAPPPSAPEAGVPGTEERQWAMFTHLSAILGYLIVPLGNIVAPLIMWLVKKDQMPFVDDQGKEALNFQITMAIAGLVSLVLTLILIGFLLLMLVWILGLVFSIVAAIKANEGVAYRYPISIRLIK